MKKGKHMEKMKGIEILFIIVPPLCVLSTTGSGQNIKDVIILGAYLLLAELATKKLDPKGDFSIEEHIVLTILKILSFFMIYVVLVGDRILSAIGFVVLAGLLYLIVVRSKKMPPRYPPKPNWNSPQQLTVYPIAS